MWLASNILWVLMAHAKWFLLSVCWLQQKELIIQSQYLPEVQPEDRTVPSILSSNARARGAQLVRASDWHSKDPNSSSGWISVLFFFPADLLV